MQACNYCKNCELYKELNDNVLYELEKSIENEKKMLEYVNKLENELVKTQTMLKITKEKFDLLDLAFQKLKVLFNNFLIKSNIKDNKNKNEVKKKYLI
jgi:hypothetical protein